MKATIDQEGCIGCGLCPSICPEVFRMNGDKAEVYQTPVPASVESQVAEAAESCPVSVIDTQG